MEETPDIGVSSDNGRLAKREDDSCCNVLGVQAIQASRIMDTFFPIFTRGDHFGAYIRRVRKGRRGSAQTWQRRGRFCAVSGNCC